MMEVKLVSVIVTTYNSASFVLETLESIKKQTYKNIELVVSDDASADQTVAIAEKWLAENRDHFLRTEVITVPFNTGVSANCNRCIAAAKADWIKFIAGDDILLPNCIEDNVRFVQTNPDAQIVFSQVKVYRDHFSEDYFVRTIPQEFPVNIMDTAFSAADQFKLLLISDRISFTPSYFFNKNAILAVGGYDERNRFVEDYPMWLKLTQAGYRLHFFKSTTVGYRQHEMALNNKIRPVLIKPSILKSYDFRRHFVHQFLPWDLVWSERFSTSFMFIFDRFGLNKDVFLFRWMLRLFTIYLNPFHYIVYLRKRLLKIDNIFFIK